MKQTLNNYRRHSQTKNTIPILKSNIEDNKKFIETIKITKQMK